MLQTKEKVVSNRSMPGEESGLGSSSLIFTVYKIGREVQLACPFEHNKKAPPAPSIQQGQFSALSFSANIAVKSHAILAENCRAVTRRHAFQPWGGSKSK